MKTNITTLFFIIAFTTLNAQNFSKKSNSEKKTSRFCFFSAANSTASEICPNVQFNGFRTNDGVEKVVDEITSQIGLKPNFILIPCPDIKNAAALIYNDNLRYIVYDKDFLDGIAKNAKTNWSNTMILSHEIGHHLNGHTLNAGNKEETRKEELEADEFAGFILGRMGATEAEAIAAMNGIPHPDCDLEYFSDHPCKTKRVEAIKTGWRKATGKKYVLTAKQKASQQKVIPVQRSTLKGTWYTELDNERGADGFIPMTITFVDDKTIHYRFFDSKLETINDEYESQYTLEGGVLVEVMPYNPGYLAKAKVQMLSSRALLLTIVDNGIEGYEGLKRVYVKLVEQE